MKMLLHELHPAVIHTPLALLPTATVADVIAVTTGDRAWAKVGRRLWVAGTLSALFSGLAGLAASQEVKLEEPPCWREKESGAPPATSGARVDGAVQGAGVDASCASVCMPRRTRVRMSMRSWSQSMPRGVL